MKQSICAVGVAASLLFFASPACTQTLTPEQKQTLTGLKTDLKRIRQEIEQAVQENEKYSGGLIKALIGVRVEILKTNAALVEQRIHTLEGGALQSVIVNVTKPDPARADQLVSEIAAQENKVAEARREADRYSGGLVKALSESTVATARNSLAMLEQQYFIAKYGLAMPAVPQGSTEAAKTPATAAPRSTGPASASSGSKVGGCLKVETFDSSVLSSNDVYTELAWKVDVLNSCAESFGVRVTFTIFDKDEFELDSDSEEVFVSANGVGKARGKMLVSPPEKARRMARQGASLSAR